MFAIHMILTLLILGFGLRMALQLTYGARGPQPHDIIYRILAFSSWALIYGAVGPLLILISGWFGIILLALVVIAGFEMLAATLASVRQTNLKMLDLAMERDLPIGPALLKLVSKYNRPIRRSTGKLADEIQRGVPLLTAFKENRQAIPGNAIAYLAAGEALGIPALGLHEVANVDTKKNDQTIWRMLLDRIFYLLLISFVMGSVLMFMMVWIVPSFEKIFAEFDIEAPKTTTTLIAATYLFYNFFGIILLLVILALLILLICFILRFFKMPVFSWLTSCLYRSQHRGLVLRALALAAEHGRPMVDMAVQLSNHYSNPSIARRIRMAADRMTGGVPWQDALVQSGLLGRGDRGVLRSAQQAGNVAWAMRTVADRQEERASLRLFAILQFVYPICLLLIAAVVGFIVVSLFMPLAVIIQTMAA
ncbi:MAG: type II secretion system F family protein [Pirellulales bacterium]|nr:type II secretion system F family protein [Pirellulales bacterium]